MNWGRYGEIFDYDRESGRLVQTEGAHSEMAPAVETLPNGGAHANQPRLDGAGSEPTAAQEVVDVPDSDRTPKS
jgi:hypothetical protein